MKSPRIVIDLDKIEHNTRTITALCNRQGIDVTGVTKVTCGHPAVAKAMLRGGVSSIADSRLENIQRMKAAGVDTSFMLLRLPALSAVDEVVAATDISLNSEVSVLEALSSAAINTGKVHDVILMVDLGDLREGILQQDFKSLVAAVANLQGVRIRGIGTNLACFGGIIPDVNNMSQLIELAAEIEQTAEHNPILVSGFNSSGLTMLAGSEVPAGINHARIGEGILLGRETIHRTPWPDTFQDAFVLHAEILELKTKPSSPAGVRGEDAFGGHEKFEDRGQMTRALVNAGREDVEIMGITPTDEDIQVVGGTSGYVVLDVTATGNRYKVGDTISFNLDYGALLRAMTSQYVVKACTGTDS